MSRALLLTIDRAVARRAESVRLLRELGIDFEIVDGIDGKATTGLLRTADWPMKATEVACYYTHLRAYRRLLDYGWQHALIFEDDFAVERTGLPGLLSRLPQPFDLIALHSFDTIPNDPKRIIQPGIEFHRLRPCGLCLPGYVVSRRLAEHVLAKFPVCTKPIDNLFCDISNDPDFHFFESAAPLIGVREVASTIHT